MIFFEQNKNILLKKILFYVQVTKPLKLHEKSSSDDTNTSDDAVNLTEEIIRNLKIENSETMFLIDWRLLENWGMKKNEKWKNLRSNAFNDPKIHQKYIFYFHINEIRHL